MHRLFLGLRPPAAIRAALMEKMTGVVGARWQDDAQLHITVRFVGAVERPLAEELALALGSLHAPAIEARLAGVGRFEHGGRTDALWAGVAPVDPLVALHRKVDRACVRLGLAPERRAYVPHVTLARFSRSAGDTIDQQQWLSRHAALASAPFQLDHLILFESHLGHGSAQYGAIARYPLVPAISPA